MCGRDWYRLPAHLRTLIWEHYRPGQNALSCSPEYRDVLRDVLAYARRVNAEAEQQAERQRQAERDQGALLVSAPFRVHVTDQVLAALAEAAPMPLSTREIQDRTGYGVR